MFSPAISEIEPSDHPLGPGEIFAIYAKGQTVHDHNFYRHDEVKYHGSIFFFLLCVIEVILFMAGKYILFL